MKLLLSFSILFLSFTGFAQFINPASAAKMVMAKQKLYAGDYIGALNSFRELEKSDPSDAVVKYYVGYCYFTLKQYDKAEEALLKAFAINDNVKPETYEVLGRVYQQQEKFDQAIEQLTKYKAVGTDKVALEEADLALSQCRNAKTLMASPLNVEVSNLGETINSKYDDKNPCITADAKKLVFTTRRPETTSDPVDKDGDGKYFENIYLALHDSVSDSFSKAVNIGPPINTPAHDACTSISPDGKQLFLYKNDINNKASRGGNIFVSKTNNGKWKTPETMGKPVNSSYWEGGACISPNGKQLFFTSERPGGFGGSDIWMVEKINKTEWGKPVNLGSEINSSYDEAGMFLAPDGKTLFFCSNGPLSMGSYDVFKTVYENGKWSAPVNLGYPINSPAREGQLTVSADARYAYISSDRKGGIGENDIYRIDLKDYAILEKDGRRNTNGLSILKGTIRDGFEGFGIQDVDVKLTDENGNTVNSTVTNEAGEYFFTLHGGKYTLHISKKGFKDITESLELAASTKNTVIMEKGFLLKK